MPVPFVRQIGEVERDGWWLLPLPVNEFWGPTVLVDAPPEVYLRQFRDTPADDLDALTELCKLGQIRPMFDPYSDLPIKSDEQWQRSLVDLETTLWPGQPLWPGDEDKREEVSARHPGRGFYLVHAAEVAWRVRAMQRTTNHLLAYLAGEPLTPHWRDCEDEGDAWRKFISFTGAALRDFHVRVELETVGRPQPPEDTTLYTAAMLQLVNDLAANETVHRCANETCGRPFVRQLGRSTYGGHRRTGTLYCTSRCARAQYQREKRRRDRAAREERQG